MNKIIQGDCLEKLKDLDDNSIDAIVTDPPYELGFMGKEWDKTGIANNVEVWEECLRVLKPGGHLLSFGGTRTYHRMASAIEDADFEIRDMIEWVYGSGFPKSHNIGKAVGTSEWEGWGTALKPAHEPICMAMKPREGTFANNVLKYGVGGINIDESRVEHTSEEDRLSATPQGKVIRNNFKPGETPKGTETNRPDTSLGRFPANLIHDNSEEVRECFPDTKTGGGNKANKVSKNRDSQVPSTVDGGDWKVNSGNASRYFKSIKYCPKASKKERNRGCGDIEPQKQDKSRKEGNPGGDNPRNRGVHKRKNHHPTVKPLELMEYLINMVTKKGQVVLDPFAGSGTTLMAAKKLGRDYIGIELNPEYIEIAEARIKSVQERLL